MSDEPTLEDVLAGMEDVMNESGSAGGQPGQEPGGSGAPGATAGQAGSPGTAGGETATAGGQQGAGSTAASGSYGQGSTRGPLTPGEQVAILDAQLEQGTGDFDAMILEEQARQREAARASTTASGAEQDSGSGGGTTGGGYGNPDMDGVGGGVARSGSQGGGIGGVGGGQDIPRNTPKYPPPEDIPDGNDDDVVARQLREAAMREPDPAVREKLWDEYRKYKGISQ
mgnify:CR=1 FL=1